MPNIPAGSLNVQDGVRITLWYQDANNRISGLDWEVPQGMIVQARIWDTRQSETEPIVDQIETTSGSQTVPGIHTMIEEDIGGEIVLVPPEYLLYVFETRSFA